MTWIKTNFLWVCFRSGWASKHNQERLLAIWLKRSAFERYLEAARTHGSVRGFDGTVRLQWDPDHLPNGAKHPYRRAVQLGLKEVGSFLHGDDILQISDITAFVAEQRPLAMAKGKGATANLRKGDPAMEQLLVARERVYVPESAKAREALNLSPFEESTDT